MTKTLPDKQIAFCYEYIKALSVSCAAKAAGVTTMQGYNWLKQPDVMEFIDGLRAERQHRYEDLSFKVIDELAKLAMIDMQRLHNNNGDVLPIHKMDRDAAASIKDVKIRINDDGSYVYEYKLHDKVQALEKLARHLNLFAEDNRRKVDHTIDGDNLMDKLREIGLDY